MFKLLFVPTFENRYEPYLLRKTALFFYTLVLVFVNILPSSLSGLATKVSADSINSETLISYTNRDRNFYGLNELATNSQLTAAAYAKANNMLELQYWDHFGPTGETPWQFIRGAGYEYIYAGENLAKGFKSSEGVHQAWMNSPTHRENILSENYKDIGIAVVSGKLQGEDVVLVVQMFGNLTTDVQKTTNPTNGQNLPQQTTNSTENGQIKSIKIMSPKQDSLINTPKVTISGEVDVSNGDYSVNVRDFDKVIGTVKSNGSSWEFTSQNSWSDGKHEVTVYTDSNGNNIQDNVNFELDTTPPKIVASSVSITSGKLSIGSGESALVISLILDGKSYDLSEGSASGYSLTIPSGQQEVKKAVIFARDKAGNTSEVDITELFNKGLSKNAGQTQVLGVSSIIPSMSGKDVVNLVVALFVALLLIIEIVYYRRLGKLHERVYSVFFVGMWCLMAFYSVIIGFGGSINV